MKLSVAIATYNEEKNIERCLSSVASWVDEIVLVDGGSTDKTVELARKFKARIIITTNPPLFHINKQKALDNCCGDWILQLDADEVVGSDLKEEIMTIMEMSNAQNGYYIPRRNYFLGDWLRKGGQYPDYVIRLFKRGKGMFPAKSIHEQIVIDGSTDYLSHALDHYSYISIDQYWKKSHAYIQLTADELKNKSERKSLKTFFSYCFIKPGGTFLSLFVRHKGFIDGWRGFLFALFSALHFPKAYMLANKITND